MLITDELIAYLEALGKIKIDENQTGQIRQELQKILSYIETLNELDTDGVEPLSHVIGGENVFREDTVAPSADRDLLLSNAALKKDGCFMAPRTFE